MPAERAVSNSPSMLAHRRGDYGFDAPFVPIMLGTIGLVFTVIGILALRGTNLVAAIFCLAYGIFMLLSSASYIYTTRVGNSSPGLLFFLNSDCKVMSECSIWVAVGVLFC